MSLAIKPNRCVVLSWRKKQGLPLYRTCTIILNTADAQALAKSRNEAINRISSRARELDNIGNQAWETTVNLANLLWIPEPEITDKDAIQAPKIEAIIQELEAMMKEREIVGKDTVQKSKCRSKTKTEPDTVYHGCHNFNLDRWRWCQGVREAAKIKVV